MHARSFVAVVMLAASTVFAGTPSKEECDVIFAKEKGAMNSCTEKKCRGKPQPKFAECMDGCALERSEKYQACYAKYVLDM